MKVLIVGNANHIFVINFVKWMKRALGPEITIHGLTGPVSKDSPARDYFDRLYEVRPDVSGIKRPIKGILFTLFEIFTTSKILNKYDICHIQGLSYTIGIMLSHLLAHCDRMIVTVWGSDFYAEKSKFKRRLQKRLIEKAHVVTLGNKEMASHVARYFDIPNDKISIASFASDPLEELKKMQAMSRGEAKRILGLDPQCIAITCGYSSRAEHRQCEFIRMVDRKRSELPKNIMLLFPMTYGDDVKNIQNLQLLLKQTGIPFKLYNKFLSIREIALLRKASDIMIHIVDHDQGAASLEEYLYAENIVVTGEWLPYSLFDSNGIFWKKVTSVAEVDIALLECVNNLNNYRERCKVNREIVETKDGWENTITLWLNLYNKHRHN